MYSTAAPASPPFVSAAGVAASPFLPRAERDRVHELGVEEVDLVDLLAPVRPDHLAGDLADLLEPEVRREALPVLGRLDPLLPVRLARLAADRVDHRARLGVRRLQREAQEVRVVRAREPLVR
ncbi:MAG TPA: hypothetical protein VHF22_11050, partial [Planctomycetota bacterium]|nr:hypothetical protein [Planctomycetota bacterium]